MTDQENHKNSVQNEQFGKETEDTNENIQPMADKTNSGQHQSNAPDTTDAVSLPEKQVTPEQSPDLQPEDDKTSPTAKTGEESIKPPLKDYTQLDTNELLNEIKKLNQSGKVHELKQEADLIKSCFYKQVKAGNEKAKENFIADGGNSDEFTPEQHPLEAEMKAEIKKFQELKQAYTDKLEAIKKSNLEAKYKIIEEIEQLINGQESFNKTFQEFRELQKRWRETGPVPQSDLKKLWDRYNYEVEKFYDYIKINKELRDLDFKKNMESKIKLCEKAEELLLEKNVVNAFKTLQKYHDHWRDIGPVPPENRNELWDRFKHATSQINKKHHEYFENLKKEQKVNLEKKTLLCEKAEEIANTICKSHKEWDDQSKALIELQGVWKTIGFAPKKSNNIIYERFRSACDKFFNGKREFYAQNKEEQNDNLQQKLELCLQAEALQNSTDWKNTTNELIQLQKKWKETGPVPRKQSDEVWKRFRSACDNFFNRKSDHFNNIDDTYAENLKKKNEIIEKIEQYQLTNDIATDLNQLKKYQREWAEIGFVPFKEKDKIQEHYRTALNKHFEKLSVDDDEKGLLKYKAKIESIAAKPRPMMKLRQEREKQANKLKQLENDITLWENNIGFFAKSKNASEMIKDFESKIESGKEKIIALEDKVRLIDEVIDTIE